MKKVIVATHDWISPIYGGGALRTLLVSKKLKEEGYDVTIIAPSKTDNIDGMKVIHIPAPRKVRSQILSAIKFNVRLLVKMLRFVSTSDLIFLHNTIAAPSALFLSKIFKKKIVLDITDLHAEYLKVGRIKFFEKLARPFLIWLEYFMISLVDCIIVVTKAMKEYIIGMGIRAEKVNVVYDGAERIPPQPKDDDFYYNIIHLGTIDKQHGVDTFVKSIPFVVKRFPSAKFFFVGGGRELKNVINLAKDLNVYEYCEFSGYVPYEETRNFLKRSNIGVIPRPDCLPNHLIVTLKLFEYWLNNVVVVASRLRGISEISKNYENIVFFRPDDAKDLAEKIIELLSSEEKIERIKNSAFKTLENFYWDRLIPQIVNIIHSSLKK